MCGRGSPTAAPAAFNVCAAMPRIDIPTVNQPETSNQESAPSQVSKNVFRLLLAIVIVLALVAVYANVQRARRARTETVTFVPATAVPSPSPTPR
jgi:hypothetical protein